MKNKSIKLFETTVKTTFYPCLCKIVLPSQMMVERFAAKQNCLTCALKSSVPSLVVCPEVVAVVVILVPGW